MAYTLLLGLLTVLCVTEAVNGIKCSYYDHDYNYENDWTYRKVTKYKNCDSSCCGTMSNRYCCAVYSNVNVGLITGISVGSILLVITVVTVFVVICCCCCKRSNGRPGQVFQPASVTTTTTVHGMQGIPQTTFGQAGYVNGAYPMPIQTANMVPGTAQKWQEPPPEYTASNNN